MYTKQIRYFLTLAEAGNFRRAATILSISQPALSNSIKALEAEHRVELFERGPLGARLTEAGRALHGFLRSAEDSIERGKREVDLFRKGSRGHVAVGAPTGLIDQLLPEILTRLATESHGATFTIKHGYVAELFAQVRSQRLDVLVTTYWPDATFPSDVVIERFAEFPLSIYCRPRHPLARKAQVSVGDLAAASWILPESQGMKPFLQQIFGVEYVEELRRPFVHDYSPFMLRMLQSMDLVSLVPDYTAAEHVRAGTLRKLPYQAFDGRLLAGLIYLRNRHFTPALQEFIRMAKELGTRQFGKAAGAARAGRRAD